MTKHTVTNAQLTEWFKARGMEEELIPHAIEIVRIVADNTCARSTYNEAHDLYQSVQYIRDLQPTHTR